MYPPIAAVTSAPPATVFLFSFTQDQPADSSAPPERREENTEEKREGTDSLLAAELAAAPAALTAAAAESDIGERNVSVREGSDGARERVIRRRCELIEQMTAYQ